MLPIVRWEPPMSTPRDPLTPTERRTLTELLRARLMLTRSGRARLARLLAKAGAPAFSLQRVAP